MERKVRYGMVGGDLKAFIGGVHRNALCLVENAQLVAGCFTPNPETNWECGEFYELDDERIYSDYKAMAQAESNREDKIDFVVIVTPNYLHYEVAKEFILHGIHVMCEKPLCFEIDQAKELQQLSLENHVLFGVNYSYCGNNLLKYAKQIVREGFIGDIINVNAEYLQEWLIDDIGAGDETTNKLSVWRKNPELSGISNCVGDIGTHIEHTVSYITGLKISKVAAVLDYYNQPLDLNANMLVEFDNGSHGTFCCSQVCVGHANGLVVRIFGTEGSLEWQQENSNYLYVTKKGQPTQIINRGMGYVTGRAAKINSVPSGHPEGLVNAFANVYKSFTNAVLKKAAGEALTEDDLDFPDVEAGIHGIRFIHAAVESNNNQSKWITL
jgi:predicted dehydrogenase